MLRATVVGIFAGSSFSDGERRIELKFDDAEIMYRNIRIPEHMLGAPVTLDAEVTLSIVPVGAAAGAAAKKASH